MNNNTIFIDISEVEDSHFLPLIRGVCSLSNLDVGEIRDIVERAWNTDKIISVDLLPKSESNIHSLSNGFDIIQEIGGKILPPNELANEYTLKELRKDLNDLKKIVRTYNKVG